MKVTLRELFGSITALNELLTVPMPAPLAFRVRKLADVANVEIERAKLVIQEEISRKQAELGDDPAANAKLNEELDQLLDEEVELPGDPISVARLGDVQIKPGTLFTLDWLIVE